MPVPPLAPQTDPRLQRADSATYSEPRHENSFGTQVRKTDVWRDYNRPLCYHCGEAGHVYRRCPYREIGFAAFHPPPHELALVKDPPKSKLTSLPDKVPRQFSDDRSHRLAARQLTVESSEDRRVEDPQPWAGKLTATTSAGKVATGRRLQDLRDLTTSQTERTTSRIEQATSSKAHAASPAEHATLPTVPKIQPTEAATSPPDHTAIRNGIGETGSADIVVSLDGRQVTALVDTGADYSVISQTLADRPRKVKTPWFGPQIRSAGVT